MQSALRVAAASLIVVGGVLRHSCRRHPVLAGLGNPASTRRFAVRGGQVPRFARSLPELAEDRPARQPSAGRAWASSRRRCAWPNSAWPGPRRRSCTRRDPTGPEAMTLYGDALWSSGLFEEAETKYRDALAAAPDLARGHHGMAQGARGARPADRGDERGAGGAAALAPRPRNPPHRRHRLRAAAQVRGSGGGVFELRQPAAEQGPQREGGLVARRNPLPALVRAARAVRIGSRHRRQALHRRLPAGERQGRRARQGQRRARRRTSSSTPARRTRSSRARRRSGSASRRSPTRSARASAASDCAGSSSRGSIRWSSGR